MKIVHTALTSYSTMLKLQKKAEPADNSTVTYLSLSALKAALGRAFYTIKYRVALVSLDIILLISLLFNKNFLVFVYVMINMLVPLAFLFFSSSTQSVCISKASLTSTL